MLAHDYIVQKIAIASPVLAPDALRTGIPYLRSGKRIALIQPGTDSVETQNWDSTVGILDKKPSEFPLRMFSSTVRKGFQAVSAVA